MGFECVVWWVVCIAVSPGLGLFVCCDLFGCLGGLLGGVCIAAEFCVFAVVNAWCLGVLGVLC